MNTQTLPILPLLLLLLLLLDEHSLAQKAIPDDIRKRVHEARTFDELLSTTKLSYATHLLGNEDEPTFNDQKELQPVEIRSYKNRKLYAASVIEKSANTRKSDFREDNDDANTRESLEILSTIRQGTDICELHKACIPILPENPDPGLLIFPRCYEVTQCIGTCCEFTEHCHPTTIEHIQQPLHLHLTHLTTIKSHSILEKRSIDRLIEFLIVEMLYAGNNLFVINQTRNITIEQHTACSCQTCTRFGAAIQCSLKKTLGPNCECECGNREEKRHCQGPKKIWNEETCTCSCVNSCYERGILDTHTCLCHYQGNDQNYGNPDASRNFRSDISILPRFRPARRMSMKTAL